MKRILFTCAHLFFGLAAMFLLFALPLLRDIAHPGDEALLPLVGVMLCVLCAFLWHQYGRLMVAEDIVRQRRLHAHADTCAANVMGRVRLNRTLKGLAQRMASGSTISIN